MGTLVPMTTEANALVNDYANRIKKKFYHPLSIFNVTILKLHYDYYYYWAANWLSG